MRYKFLYYKIVGGERIITVLDFKEGRLITFDLEALQSDELDEDLKGYMRSIWKSHVLNSAYESKGTPYK